MFVLLVPASPAGLEALSEPYAERDTAWLTSSAEPGVSKRSEQFDRLKWQRWRQDNCGFGLPILESIYKPQRVDPGVRLKEGNDFLTSYPVIGMKREKVLSLLGDPDRIPKTLENGAEIDAYQLNFHYCDLAAPLFYLELEYSNGTVCAFRFQHVDTFNSPNPQGLQQGN
jgi:hypothetical protein